MLIRCKKYHATNPKSASPHSKTWELNWFQFSDNMSTKLKKPLQAGVFFNFDAAVMMVTRVGSHHPPKYYFYFQNEHGFYKVIPLSVLA